MEEREQKLVEGGLNPADLVNVTLVHRLGNAVIRRHLEALPMETFDSVCSLLSRLPLCRCLVLVVLTVTVLDLVVLTVRVLAVLVLTV